jgi:hypothetical protein
MDRASQVPAQGVPPGVPNYTVLLQIKAMSLILHSIIVLARRPSREDRASVPQPVRRRVNIKYLLQMSNLQVSDTNKVYPFTSLQYNLLLTY